MGIVSAKRRSYGIPSQKRVSFLRADRLLRERGAVLDGANSNCLFAHSGKESMKHWIVKALLFKALRDLGRTVGTEIETAGGIVDVLDADSLVAYEVETDIDRAVIERKCRRLWRMHDVVFVDASKVPDGIADAERCLRGLIV
ncbi:MAG: hypothetical protein NT016_02810 [Candidatus Aenigmarchaeota archaeon]|nr:hypothetical protein [Candidatus Aenigmarchaeota archaeon]